LKMEKRGGGISRRKEGRNGEEGSRRREREGILSTRKVIFKERHSLKCSLYFRKKKKNGKRKNASIRRDKKGRELRLLSEKEKRGGSGKYSLPLEGKRRLPHSTLGS